MSVIMSSAPSSARVWMQTYTGLSMHPLHPDPAEISIIDIAPALSMICRFSGMTRVHYSVAEHSVRVSWVVPPQDAFWGLMHDASEYALGDVNTILKKTSDFGPPYKVYEKALMEVICDKFGLSHKEPTTVKQADLILLMTEKRDLLGDGRDPWYGGQDIECLKEHIFPWPQEVAEIRFLARFKELYWPDATQNEVR